jgi:glycine cleavage system transcriptional repressor
MILLLNGGIFMENTRNLLVTIVGKDRTGLVHLVSTVLFEHSLVISELTQTTLLGQFAGLFSVLAPEGLDTEALSRDLKKRLLDTGFSAWITPISQEPSTLPAETAPYVMTITGPDSPGLIPAVTGTVASFDVNIDNLRSVTLSGTSGEEVRIGSNPRVLVLELSAPPDTQGSVFRQALQLTAEEHGVEISLQHRDIFEAIHRL